MVDPISTTPWSIHTQNTDAREQQREEEERSRDPAVVAAREKEEAAQAKLQAEIDQVLYCEMICGIYCIIL